MKIKNKRFHKKRYLEKKHPYFFDYENHLFKLEKLGIVKVYKRGDSLDDFLEGIDLPDF